MANSERSSRMLGSYENKLVFEGLTDGVFAIVMTLLVFNITVPIFLNNSVHQEFSQLIVLWPKFVSYFVTFLILGFNWYIHHEQFSFIRRSDSILVWTNIMCLMFTSLLPFSTSLIADNLGDAIPTFVYEGNYLMCILAGYLNWAYTTGNRRLVDAEIDQNEIDRRKIMFLGGMGFTALAMGISFLNAVASISMFVVYFIWGTTYVTLRLRIRGNQSMAT